MKQIIEQAEQKYLVVPNGLDADDSLAYMSGHKDGFENGSNWQKEQGNIQWFEIAKDGLPKIPDTGNISDPVLLYRYGYGLITGNLHRTGWLKSENWEPTHWAYFNLPKPE